MALRGLLRKPPVCSSNLITSNNESRKLRCSFLKPVRYTSTEVDESSCIRRVGCGLLLGIYSKNDGRYMTAVLTATGQKYDKRTCGRLRQLLLMAGPCPKLGEVRVFYDLEPEFSAVAVVGLGDECDGYSEEENLDKGKENIRVAASVGAKTLTDIDIYHLYCESLGHAESCAEGCALAIYLYQEYKSRKKGKPPVYLELYDDTDFTGWQIGLHKAAAQNLAKGLMEAPANEMTPLLFAQKAIEILCKAGVNVQVRVRNWAELLGMGGFLAVSKGSCQEPLILEIAYHGCGCCTEKPIVLIGKGCTFDSGGICLKDKADLVWARGDMAGAACVVASIRAVASLQLPLNIRGLIPLAEHMPGCNAMKPGDIVEAYNKKSILIQNTRNHSHLMLADVLSYAGTYCPWFTLDVASISQEATDLMSTSASLVFTNSDHLWNTIQMASVHTGDRVWRLPLFHHYTLKMTTSSSVDTKNAGRPPPSGETCRAAGFLKEFVPCMGDWLHIDNHNVMVSDGITDSPYLRRGMTGRPTRTLIEFLSQLICKQDC